MKLSIKLLRSVRRKDAEEPIAVFWAECGLEADPFTALSELAGGS